MYTDISATDFDNKADKATTLGGYGITDAYTKTEIDTKLSTVYKVKGSVNDYSIFEMVTNHEVGDVYNLQGVYTTSYNTTVDKNAFQYTYNSGTSKQYLVAEEISAAYQWLNNAKIKIHTGTDTKTGVLIETTDVTGWELTLDDGTLLTSDVYDTVTSIDLTVYHDFKAGDNVVYIKGGFWDKLAATVDLSSYATETELERLKYYGDKDILPSDESYFTVNETGETITGLTDEGKTQTELVIPYKIEGQKIAMIGQSAFSNCTSLNSVNVPNNVTMIGNGAFVMCTSLTSINIPNSVTSIGYASFSGTSLNSINIPDSITSINQGTFGGCTSLTSINIPNSVTSIERNAFIGCSALTSINIPSNVTSIGDDAFHMRNEAGDNIPLPNLTIYCEQGSYAETYAKTNNIPVVYTEIKDTTLDSKADKSDTYTKTEVDTAIQNAILDSWEVPV